eukprot:9345473-Alexandrium_andersonii.AAC.1
MAVVRRLRKLSRRRAQAKRHALPDSDLCGQCAAALQRRGWDAVAVTRTKSHQDPRGDVCPLD